MGIIIAFIKKFGLIIISFFTKKSDKLMPVATAVVGVVVASGAGYIKRKKAIEKAYKRGYKDASSVYEKKLKKQTEEFLSNKKSYEKNFLEYQKLLDGYEAEIERLKNTPLLTKEEKAYHDMVHLEYEELQELKKEKESAD